MEQEAATTAGTTVGVALAVGMIAQALARHLRMPGIVLLLGAGILLGPDLLGVIEPDSLGDGLNLLVGFAVAVILFEGGMNLNLKRLQREALVIRRLLIFGPAITAVGGALAAHYLMGWDWRLATAFGVLVIVSGPTVITPLLRRIKVKHSVATILEGEGVLIDAIGAVIAVVTLQVIIGTSITEGVVSVFARLGFGLLCGITGGFVIALLLRVERVVPEGLENVFTLSLVLALFQLSNAILPESGIMSVTSAGLIVGNMRTHVHRDLLEFKEQLTVMLIGLLFVLLAADVRITEVRDLGWPGVATVAALMLVVRPVNVALCTWKSGLGRRAKLFIAWLSPRGVVAAAMAALFAQSFETAGIEGGRPLEALVFLVIAATVVIQGLSGGLVADALGLRRPSNQGYVILGANDVGLAIGRLLRMADVEVLFVDSSPSACLRAEEGGFRVIFGNGIQERTMQRAQLEDRSATIAVTTNDEVNLLHARAARGEFKVPRVCVAVRPESAVTPSIVTSAGAAVLFGAPRDADMWSVRLRRAYADIEAWHLEEKPDREEGSGKVAFVFPRALILPLVQRRGNDAWPVNSEREMRKGDVCYFAVSAEEREAAHIWLSQRGFTLVETLDRDAPVAGVTVVPAVPPRAPAGA